MIRSGRSNTEQERVEYWHIETVRTREQEARIIATTISRGNRRIGSHVHRDEQVFGNSYDVLTGEVFERQASDEEFPKRLSGGLGMRIWDSGVSVGLERRRPACKVATATSTLWA